MLPGGAGGGDAQIGFGFREMEHLGRVGEHRRRGRAGVQTTRVDLGDVCDEVGLDASRLPQDLGEPAQQLVVRNGPQLVVLHDADNIRRHFSTSWRVGSRDVRLEVSFDDTWADCEARYASRCATRQV